MNVPSTEFQQAENEFDLLDEHAAELDLAPGARLPVRRLNTSVDGRVLSALRWGERTPLVVCLHGGGQNAHTWDSVLFDLGIPALAIDLPGHGHSSWRGDRDYSCWTAADAIAPVLHEWAPEARTIIGMSLGGLTTIRLSALLPDTVERAVVVDVTPSVHLRWKKLSQEQKGTTALIGGTRVFAHLEEMIRSAAVAAPTRSPASLRRSVLYNSRPAAQGGFEWRYDLLDKGRNDSSRLWDDVSASAAHFTLVRGGLSGFVSTEDVAEFVHRSPATAIRTVPGAGHSVQSDRPHDLAEIVRQVITD